MTNWVDTHAHLYAKEFDQDREKMIHQSLEKGVSKICLPNIDADSLDGMFDMQDKWPENCYPMIGLHPCSVKEDYAAVLKTLHTRLQSEMESGNTRNVVAVGETGLDYYWDTTLVEEQKKALDIQIDWAKSFDLPIVLHCRDAFNDLIEIIEKQQDGKLKGIFHCFTGTTEEAQRVIDAGFYLGIGGVLTFKNSKLATQLQNISLERIVLETDSPYLAPAPFRGKRNESSYIPLIGEKLSETFQKSEVEIANITTKNAFNIFNL